jgi:protein TonB
METRFIIPAAVAMSLHALALFSFPRGSVVTRSTPLRPVDPPPIRVSWADPDPPAPTDCEDPAVQRGDPDPAPRALEPLVPPDPSGMEMPLLPPNPHSEPDRPVTKIPLNPPGDPSGTSGHDGTEIISAALLDKLPRTRAQAAPVYPYEARSRGRPGEVLVEFTVDEAGRVLDPHVVRSSGQIFEGPTLRAVAKWRFEPGRRNGRAVRFRMALPVNFSVDP